MWSSRRTTPHLRATSGLGILIVNKRRYTIRRGIGDRCFDVSILLAINVEPLNGWNCTVCCTTCYERIYRVYTCYVPVPVPVPSVGFSIGTKMVPGCVHLVSTYVYLRIRKSMRVNVACPKIHSSSCNSSPLYRLHNRCTRTIYNMSTYVRVRVCNIRLMYLQCTIQTCSLVFA